MEITDIAAASITMNMVKLQMSVSTSVAKKAMDDQETAAQNLLEMLPDVTGLGQNIDMNA